jgi:hypothetical protein
MFDTVDFECDAPHGGRQLRGGRLRLLLLLLRCAGLSCRRGWNCNGRAARPGLNWRYRLLGSATRDGNARSGDDTNCDRARASADEEVATRSERSNVLTTWVDFGRIRTGRTITFWHTDLPRARKERDGQTNDPGSISLVRLCARLLPKAVSDFVRTRSRHPVQPFSSSHSYAVKQTSSGLNDNPTAHLRMD